MDDILKAMSTKRFSKVWSNTVIGAASMLLGIDLLKVLLEGRTPSI